jgi:predicted HTH domain antitoxin
MAAEALMSAPCEVHLTIPADTAAALEVDPDQIAPELRMLAALKLYKLGRLSSGAAARLAGVPRTVLLQRLADYGVVTFDLDADELAAETPLG